MSVKEKSDVNINHDVDVKIEEGVSLEVPQLTWAEQFRALWSCKRAAAACLACSSGAVLIGYDMTLIGSIIANAEFVHKFGIHDAATDTWSLPADRQLYWSIVQYVCAMAGAIGSGYLNDVVGRRPVFLFLVACTMIGTIVELFSPDWKIWIVPKVLFGAAMGLMQGTVPAYISELAPSHVRGFLLAMFQFWIMFGSFVASCVLQGTSTVAGPWSWKGCVISQLPLGILCLTLFIPLVPESPYYLASRSRNDAAKKALLTLRGSEPHYDAEDDLAKIIEVLEHGRQGRAVASSYIECFQGTNLRRTFLACLPMVMQHFLGFPLCGNYVAYFLTLSGVKNPFVITVISITMAMLAILLAFVLIELIGRRPQYLFGTFSVLPCLLCIGILGFLKPTTAVMTGVGALCIIWSFLWYLSVGAVGWTIVGEISSPRLRPKTVSIAAMVNSLINMGWSIAIPYLVNAENANLGPKTALVFFAPSVFFAALAYFVLPETKGKTFEQLDMLFEERTPARKF
ncbi:general substrate transporter [Ilyonectria robusta]|uniref:general substrate transporter n=1 Tax=Ilyonectria robusta TaxID=1079257 RepID=UPI001E8E4992|nr:general substrate transporter [Ilyonectria robusta]KAH8670671.1 general substrate transporter [Ilyonectria robusta]